MKVNQSTKPEKKEGSRNHTETWVLIKGTGHHECTGTIKRLTIAGRVACTMAREDLWKREAWMASSYTLWNGEKANIALPFFVIQKEMKDNGSQL